MERTKTSEHGFVSRYRPYQHIRRSNLPANHSQPPSTHSFQLPQLSLSYPAATTRSEEHPHHQTQQAHTTPEQATSPTLDQENVSSEADRQVVACQPTTSGQPTTSHSPSTLEIFS